MNIEPHVQEACIIPPLGEVCTTSCDKGDMCTCSRNPEVCNRARACVHMLLARVRSGTSSRALAATMER